MSSATQKSFNLQTFHTPLAIKLDNENFLLWQQQVLASIRGMKLQKFITSSNVPAKFATTEDAASNTLSQDYEHHVQQDQLLTAWLLASMSTPILTKMVGLETSFQI
uniref:Retrotransposon Copia-like N-terminal domain-containing protein n=1 Tax=Cajanus cajan TaxID=3821 RepID=A0A151T197_CAJCA|nr:hypothetical protein KK1_023254 [Cajanus cajan]